MTNTQMTTGKVRFSYVHVFEPAEDPSGRMKYSTTLLIPKTDKATLNKIKACIAGAKARYKDMGGKAPENALRSTLQDGDGERPNGGAYGPECKGCYVLTVKSNNKPVIVDSQKLPITDPQELYSGCYGRAVINWYAYDQAGNRGVTAGLNGIMKLHDGDPLAGGVVTDADWDDDWEDDEDDLL